MTQPFDFEQARQAARKAAEAQRAVEELLRDAHRDLAAKERSYREALAARQVELRADGVAWSAVGDQARGDQRVAALRFERDIAAGMVAAAEQQAYRHAADRRDLHAMIQWSARVSLDVDGQDGQRPPANVQPFGGRRAA